LDYPERFDYQGTLDYSALLCASDAYLEIENELGWENVRDYAHDLVRRGAHVIAKKLGTSVVENVENKITFAPMMALVELPRDVGCSREEADAMRAPLAMNHGIEAGFTSIGGKGYIRLSAHAYNNIADFERFAECFSQTFKHLNRLDVTGSRGARRTIAALIYQILLETYPDADCELDYKNAFELLIATALSAQSTDKSVNLVTPALFAAYKNAEELSNANPEDVETIIKTTGFFRQKTRSIIGIAKALVEHYDGVVPNTLDDLVSLPGVGRKTANVVLGHAFGVPAITADTHVLRVSARLGFTDERDPVRVETDLNVLFDHSQWTKLSDVLIWHGRRCCFARRAACGACVVARYCPSYGEGEMDSAKAYRLLK
jgi:endonuclease-3